MRKLTVLIEGHDRKTIELDKCIIVTNNPYLLIKKAYVFWSYENSIGSLKFKINHNSTFAIDNGYLQLQNTSIAT